MAEKTKWDDPGYVYPRIETLFSYQRFKLPYSIWHVLFVLCFPIGVAVAVMRFCVIAVMAVLCILTPTMHGLHTILLKCLFYACGVSVRVRGLYDLDGRQQKLAPIVVSNHLTNLDGIFFRAIMPCAVVLHEKYTTTPVINQIVRAFFDPIPVGKDKDRVRDNIMNHIQQGGSQLYIMPEGVLTNGRVGIMSYAKFVFSLGHDISPLALEISENIFSLELDHTHASFLWNIFFFLVIPYHRVTYTLLPTVRISAGEQPEDFARRVQIMTAEHLHQVPTKYMGKDKQEMLRPKLN